MGSLKNIVACVRACVHAWVRVCVIHILCVYNYRTSLSHIAGFILFTVSGKGMEK